MVSSPQPALYDVPFATDSYQSMPYRTLGRSGLWSPAIGLGTWKFGYPDTGDAARVDQEQGWAILDRAAELGVTFWDTANRYNAASGNSERVIGGWLTAHPDRRRDVVLATKTMGGMDGLTPNHGGLSRLQITESVKASLERLQTDWIDVLWFHRFDERVPVEETLETFADLVSRGWVHYLGVSNFTAAQLSTYLEVGGRISHRTRPVAVQNQYDPLHGQAIPGVLELCRTEGVSYVPYSPLARGLLTDRYLDPATIGAGDRLFDEGVRIDPAQVATVRAVGDLARTWGHSISQVTLAWILAQEGMGTQIPSSSTVAQLEANAGAGTLELSADQQAELTAVFTS